MNKKEFTRQLSQRIDYPLEKCGIINDILDEYFLIGKNNKKKIIRELIISLKIEEIEANMIYETSIEIITKSIRNKLKHPFK